MRTCDHMPGAAKEVKCPLCRDLKAHGKPVSKAALMVLQRQEKPKKMRTCPQCGMPCDGLVTIKGLLMCDGCAERLDENS